MPSIVKPWVRLLNLLEFRACGNGVYCSLVQTASTCVNDVLSSSCTAEEIAENPDFQSVGFYSPEAIDYVCVQHYDGNGQAFSSTSHCIL